MKKYFWCNFFEKPQVAIGRIVFHETIIQQTIRTIRMGFTNGALYKSLKIYNK
jgi:hypothetical protein